MPVGGDIRNDAYMHVYIEIFVCTFLQENTCKFVVITTAADGMSSSGATSTVMVKFNTL